MLIKNKLTYQLEILEMLHTLLNIGFPLSISLDIMKSKFAIDDWSAKLENGMSFYNLLLENNFDRDVLLIIKIGLDSEEMCLTIKKAKELLASKIEKRKELLELIKYPIMLLVIGSLSIAFVTLFLLPQFERLLENFNATSKSTHILYSFFKYSPLLIVFSLILVFILLLLYYRLDYDRRLKVLVKIKPLRTIYVSIYNQVFTVALSNLLKTNLHLSVIIEILSKQTENYLLAKEAKKIAKGLEQGRYISECLTQVYYDKQLISILKIGEESGMLIYYLDSYSKIISMQNKKREKKVIFLIQPTFYIVFGILILLLYAAIFIPMFSFMDSI